jgi:hypothetical protein
MKSLTALMAASAMMIAAPAFAASTIQIYNAPAGLAGNQSWTGTLGLNFTVNSSVSVTQIGVFDSGSDGISSNLFATIFDSSGHALFAPVEFAAGTPSSGGAYIFAPLSYTLTPGTYQLASWGFGDNGQNYNYGFFADGNGGPITFNSDNGALTAVSTTYSNPGTGGVFATNADNGTTRYGSATFTVAVPEPATWAMLLLGFGMIGFAMRKRSNVGTTVSYA